MSTPEIVALPISCAVAVARSLFQCPYRGVNATDSSHLRLDDIVPSVLRSGISLTKEEAAGLVWPGRSQAIEVDMLSL